MLGCQSSKRYNEKLRSLKSPEQLKSDIDFVHTKLRKYHPQLYKYTSKKELDFKFDSLKSAMDRPMDSREFFLKLSPVVSSIKQGHTALYLTTKKNKVKTKPTLNYSPSTAFRVEMIGEKLYVIKDNRKDSLVKSGTEILSINGVKPIDLFNKYKNTLSSDGYNKTYAIRAFNYRYFSDLYSEKTPNDSLICRLKYKDSTWLVDLKEPLRKTIKKPDTPKHERKTVKQTKSKEIIKTKPAKIKVKTLKFLEPDSSVALITIRNFMQGNYRKFYSQSFKSIKDANTKSLIIDLRDNGGGRLSDATLLYSYLVDTAFRMTKKFELTSRESISKTLPAVIPKSPLYPKPLLKAMTALLAVPINLYVNLHIRKHGDSYLLSTEYSKKALPQKDNFKGKVYVLINGGTFSASSIVSANLKGTNRAFFVGEETGGAYNGCVAGLLPILDLPKSKLNLRFGIFQIQPDHLSDVEGRGIFPDQEIKTALSDRLKKTDTELSWVLKDIKRKNNTQPGINQESLHD